MSIKSLVELNKKELLYKESIAMNNELLNKRLVTRQKYDKDNARLNEKLNKLANKKQYLLYYRNEYDKQLENWNLEKEQLVEVEQDFKIYKDLRKIIPKNM